MQDNNARDRADKLRDENGNIPIQYSGSISQERLDNYSRKLSRSFLNSIDPVTEFENKIAAFFGAPFSVATDSCTHAIELCLRYKKATSMHCPKRTYLSIPMLSNKLGIALTWNDQEWAGDKKAGYYYVSHNIIDAAVLWERGGYNANGWNKDDFMCLSFQYQKHLSLGRGGMILCPDKESALQLKKMSYDGREPGTPWREQDVEDFGLHYYMTPETATLGLSKLDAAIATEPRKWTVNDWPDISKFKVFNK